jgi:cytochrome b
VNKSLKFSLKVWDLPTRVFHWALLLAVVGSAYSVWVSEDMVWHARFGYAVLALCLFRLVWGFIGGHWSRFATFIPSWQASRQYLSSSDEDKATLGHNPLGAWSVYALLIFLLLQVASGLGSDDDIGFNGPLAPLLSSDWVSRLTNYHADVGRWVLIGLIALHVLAVLFYTLVKRQGLIQTMWHGVREWPVDAVASVDTWPRRLGALLIVCVIALGIAYFLQLLPA